MTSAANKTARQINRVKAEFMGKGWCKGGSMRRRCASPKFRAKMRGSVGERMLEAALESHIQFHALEQGLLNRIRDAPVVLDGGIGDVGHVDLNGEVRAETVAPRRKSRREREYGFGMTERIGLR